MIPAVEVAGARVFLGDCRDVLKSLTDNSVDSIVTDPPYELGFMGKKWDSSGIAYDVTVWEECLRVLKPGGHVLAFGGSRTWHRLAVAIEDAGFEIRDNIARFYGDPHYCGCEFPEPQMVNWSYGTGEPQTEHGVRSVRNSDLSQTFDVEVERGEILQPVLSEQGLPSAQRAECPQGAKNGKESGLEGRSDLQATKGELYGSEVRSSPGVGETDGSERRLHHGASLSDGSDVRVSIDSDGGGESQGSQSGEQSPVEPGTVSDERGSQEGRSWPICARCGKPVQPTSSGNLAWVMGSGFPKSLDVSKAIDKRLGAEREILQTIPDRWAGKGNVLQRATQQVAENVNITLPATSEAKQWQGWGTALKPAFEPVVVGRKPFGKGVTVAENVLTWGVGGLNIDGSRIGTNGEKIAEFGTPTKSVGGLLNNTGEPMDEEKLRASYEKTNTMGRWPANVILDEVSAGLLDEQSGVTKSPKPYTAEGYKDSSMFGVGGVNHGSEFGDSGGASRFFYVAKASKRDRNEGLEELPETQSKKMSGGNMIHYSTGSQVNNPEPTRNFHPTVKPTQLMRYLIKLVTPEGGVVLDPFTGSGSTGKAALLDGYGFIGAELTEEYLPIIEGRLRWASEQKGDEDVTLF